MSDETKFSFEDIVAQLDAERAAKEAERQARLTKTDMPPFDNFLPPAESVPFHLPAVPEPSPVAVPQKAKTHDAAMKMVSSRSVLLNAPHSNPMRPSNQKPIATG